MTAPSEIDAACRAWRAAGNALSATEEAGQRSDYAAGRHGVRLWAKRWAAEDGAARDASEIDRLRAEIGRLRADCERGRELLRDLSAHHDRHHEWDKVADKVFDAASALFIAVGNEHAKRPVSQALHDAARAYYEAQQAAMADT